MLLYFELKRLLHSYHHHRQRTHSCTVFFLSQKVSFSSDGERLVAVDKDGSQLKMSDVPNGPGLMSTLIKHKVCCIYLVLLLAG